MTTKNKDGETTSVGAFPELDEKQDKSAATGIWDKKVIDLKDGKKLVIYRLLNFEGNPIKVFLHQDKKVWLEYDIKEILKILE